MDKYTDVVNQIAALSGLKFAPASMSDIARLRKLGAPDQVIQFYSLYEPQNWQSGRVRIARISHMVEEVEGYVPSCLVYPHRYLMFATNQFGDAYCFDLNRLDPTGEPPIVLMSHDTYEEDSISKEQADSLAEPIASDLSAFLSEILKDNLWEE